jgi:leucyl-tRNA synthetase
MSSQNTEEKKVIVEASKSGKKKDLLLSIEKEVQDLWENEKTYEIDVPEDTSKPKYLLTFP